MIIDAQDDGVYRFVCEVMRCESFKVVLLANSNERVWVLRKVCLRGQPNTTSWTQSIGKLEITSLLHVGNSLYIGGMESFRAVIGIVDLENGRAKWQFYSTHMTVNSFSVSEGQVWARAESFLHPEIEFQVVEKKRQSPFCTDYTKSMYSVIEPGLHFYLVFPRKPQTVNNLIVSMYGGFGLSQYPRYSRVTKDLHNAGHAVAVLNLPGGLEYGAGSGFDPSLLTMLAARNAVPKIVLELQRIVNPKQTIVTGYSHGALMAMSAFVYWPNLFDAGLFGNGPYNLQNVDLYDAHKPWLQEYSTASRSQTEALRRKISPFSSPDSNSFAKLLLLDNHEDTVVNTRHTDDMIQHFSDRWKNLTVNHSVVNDDHYESSAQKASARSQFLLGI